jgi:hypothetical protein
MARKRKHSATASLSDKCRKVTLRLPDELARRLLACAASRRKHLGDLATPWIERGLEGFYVVDKRELGVVSAPEAKVG